MFRSAFVWGAALLMVSQAAGQNWKVPAGPTAVPSGFSGGAGAGGVSGGTPGSGFGSGNGMGNGSCSHGNRYFFFPATYYGWGYPAYSPWGYYDYQLAEQNYLLQQQNLELQRKLIEEKREQRERQIAAAKTKAEESRQRLRRERARTAVRAGGKHFANGNYKSAFERFSDAAQFTDQDAAPHFLMAQALFAQQRFSEAAEKVRSGVKLNPDWLALDFNIRSLYLKSADFDTQLARLAGNLQANPLDQDALFLLGHLLFLDGQRDSAKTILEQASLLEKDDGTIKAYMDRMAKPAEIAIPDEIAVR